MEQKQLDMNNLEDCMYAIRKAKVKKTLIEKIATQILACEAGGFPNDTLMKYKMLRKTRSKKYPYQATTYGLAYLKMSKIGQAVLSIGK